jgi:hypothetical protein
MNLRGWFEAHSLKILAIRDTPEAIAGGVAIGIFFGFSPLFGFKTLGAIVVAWLTRSNILAAVLAVTLHDIVLPVLPVVYLWEYNLGYWILHQEWPRMREEKVHLAWHEIRSWTTLLKLRKPLEAALLGSLVIGLPASVAAYFITKSTIIRHRRRKRSASASADIPPQPS